MYEWSRPKKRKKRIKHLHCIFCNYSGTGNDDLTDLLDPNRSFPSSPRPQEKIPNPSWDCVLPVRDRKDQAGEEGRGFSRWWWTCWLGSRCWLSTLRRLFTVPTVSWWWWCSGWPTVCRPSQHARTFSNPSNPSSKWVSRCNSKSSSSGSCWSGTLTNDFSGLYGLSGPFLQRRYSTAGVPDRLLADLLIDTCDLLRCPRGVVDHLSFLVGLAGLSRPGGVTMARCCRRRSSSVWFSDPGVWGKIVLFVGEVTLRLLGLESRYFRAYIS